MMLIITLVLLSLIPSQAPSQSNQIFSRLEGSWQGEGKAFGMAANLQLRWEWVLNKKFLRLTLKNEMSTASGQKQTFEGQAYYHALIDDGTLEVVDAVKQKDGTWREFGRATLKRVQVC